MWRSRLPELINRLEEKEKRRITQQEIADAAGIRRPTLTPWMNWGTFKRLDADVVGRLARYLNCRPDELVEWIEDDTEEAAEQQGQKVAVAVR